MTKALTAADIRTMRPGPARIEVKDGGAQALYLCLQPSGHRSFVMRFRGRDDRPVKLTLGAFDPSGEAEGEPVIGAPLTLAAARRLCAELLRERARGKDVVADRKQAKAKTAETFGALARLFVAEHVVPNTRRGPETARMLAGLIDRWEDKPISEVTADDIYRITEECRRLGVPGMGRRNAGVSDARGRSMARTLSKLFSWLVQHRKVTTNPCLGAYVPPAPASRERVLTSDEIVKFWKACDAEPLVGGLLKILLLTGCRLREASGMARSELSSDGAVWTLPPSRTKNKRPHSTFLPPLARELIGSVLNTGGDLIWTTTGVSPVSGWNSVKRRLDARMEGVPAWRLHDLRRTCATGMAEIGIAPHIVEACLNHVSGAKAGVAGVYNRAAYSAEKKIALERWADHVIALVEGREATVVPLRRARRIRR
jgi:integrase